jgi:SAM-dependent methyltransferase
VAVIEYLLDADRALAEIARVLAPGGFAIITVPNRASPFILLDNASKAARRVGSRAYRLLTGRPRDDGSYMHGYYTPWGLDRRIRRAGLVVEERGYSTFGSYMYGNVLPFSVALSESLGFLRHRPLGVLGSNYIVRASRPRPGAGAGDRRGRS